MTASPPPEDDHLGYRPWSRRALLAGIAAAALAPGAAAARDTRPCHPPRYLRWTAAREARWAEEIGEAGFVNYYGQPVHFDRRIALEPQSLPSCEIWGATRSSLESKGAVRDNLRGAELFGAPNSTDCMVWPSQSELQFERRVADLLRQLESQGPSKARPDTVRFCAVGSHHSSSDVYRRLPDGQAVVLHIEGLNHIMLDRSAWKPEFLARTPDRAFATVGAGITICQLNETLWTEGLAIETQGSFDGQTLAGAISTATHGAGVGEGSVADSVQAVIIVSCIRNPDTGLPRWEVLQIEPDPIEAITDPAAFRDERAGARWRLVQDSALFDAVVVSMGTMGVIAGFVMRVKKAYYLHELRVGRSWSEVRSNLVERAHVPPLGFADEGWRYELVINANPIPGASDWACTEVYRDAWSYDLNYREDVREIPQKWAGGLARNVNLGGNLGNTISRLADKSLVRGQRVGSFADRCYRVLKLGQGEFVQAWGTEMMVRAEHGTKLLDWILRTNPTCGDLQRYKPRNHRLVNPFGVRFATGRRGFLAPVRWRKNGKPATVCTVELTEAVKNNKERNLGPRDNGKPASREIVAKWADMFRQEFGADGRLHWGQVQGGYGPEDLAKAYPKEEVDAWFEAFRLMNPYGLFDTQFARRLGFVDRRQASASRPYPTYRGLGRPLVDPVVAPSPPPPSTAPVDATEPQNKP